MKYYFVSKTPESDLIGHLSIEQLVAGVNSGEIQVEYVATESFGPPYAEIIKRGDTRWVPVSELVAPIDAESEGLSEARRGHRAVEFTPPTSSALAAVFTVLGVLDVLAGIIIGLAMQNMFIAIVGISGGLMLFALAKIISCLHEGVQRLANIQGILSSK